MIKSFWQWFCTATQGFTPRAVNPRNPGFRDAASGLRLLILAAIVALPVSSEAGTQGWLGDPNRGYIFTDPLLACQSPFLPGDGLGLVFIKPTSDPAFYQCWLHAYPQQPYDKWFYNTRSPCPSNQAYNFSSSQCTISAPPKTLGCSADRGKGNPCDAGTGNKYQREEDLRGGEGIPAFVRHYNSHLNQNVGLGLGWTSSVHKKLEIYGANITLRRVNGRGELFTCTSSACTSDADTPFRLIPDVSGYTLALRDGASERYDLAGKIKSETDQLSRTTAYVYDSYGRLTLVTGPFGHTLRFGYDTSYQITSMTDFTGQVITYSYDVWWNLSRVTYPDTTAKLYH
jgi:YD repeat-containing protein